MLEGRLEDAPYTVEDYVLRFNKYEFAIQNKNCEQATNR
jgi:hypothetical protein